MQKVDVMYDIMLDDLFEEEKNEYEVKINNNKGKHVKISDRIFHKMLDEGLIKKTDDGYVFIGKYDCIESNRNYCFW